jgi:hypothetical protein
LPQEGVPQGQLLRFRWTSHTVYAGVDRDVCVIHGDAEPMSAPARAWSPTGSAAFRRQAVAEVAFSHASPPPASTRAETVLITVPQERLTSMTDRRHTIAVEDALTRLDLDAKASLLAGQDMWSLPALPERASAPW